MHSCPRENTKSGLRSFYVAAMGAAVVLLIVSLRPAVAATADFSALFAFAATSKLSARAAEVFLFIF